MFRSRPFLNAHTDTMKMRRFSLACVPTVFLGLCLVLGGSSAPSQPEHHWLQLACLCLIALVIYPSTSPLRVRPATQIACAILLLTLWPCLQLVPLSAQVWQDLGHRDIIAAGYGLLGMDSLPSLPISLEAEKTYTSLMALLPPFTFMLLIASIGRKTGAEAIVWGILACGGASAVFGLVEPLPAPSIPGWHSIVSERNQAGFFANANHHVTLLLICLPLLAGLSAYRGTPARRREVVIFRQCVQTVILLLLLSAIWAADVRAGYVLVLPVCILSTLIRRNASSHSNSMGSLATMIASVALSLALVVYAPALNSTAFADFTFSDYGRQTLIWPPSVQMLEDHWLVGTGLGTFASVFPLYEDPANVTPVWINQAHSDYLQIAIELGVPGVAMMFTGLLIWLRYTASAWTSPQDPESAIRRAASVSCLVVLLHSMVDYPARTPAILVIFVACAALTVWPRGLAPLAIRPRSKDEQQARWIEL